MVAYKVKDKIIFLMSALLKKSPQSYTSSVEVKLWTLPCELNNL